jgi:hypothetical protein
LRPVDVSTAVQNQWDVNILCWVQNAPAGGGASSGPVAGMAEDIALCGSFSRRWGRFRDRILAAARDWPKPIGGLGASHPQSNFLKYTRLGSHVTFLVDDDPAKAGRLVPLPEPVPVVTSESVLQKSFSGTLLLTAFGYDDWMRRRFGPLAKHGAMLVDPYTSEFLGGDAS